MDSEERNYDIVVVGGTPAGVMAAVAAARMGSSVALAEYHQHVGGMSTSGLGKSDVENKQAIAGIFKEFTRRVHQYYINKYGPGSENEKLCREGYYYEPSVAEMIFNEMIREEENLYTLVGHQIERAITRGNEVAEVVLKNRETHSAVTLRAKVFVDATYEGDLYALAGADYRLGREGKSEYGEPHAGKIFFDHEDHVILPGSTGEGDDNLPAYTYRLCLTDDPENSYIMREPPPGYDRGKYTAYFDDLESGRLSGPKVLKEGHGYYPAHFDTMLRVFSFAEIPNNKYDVNINPRALGFPFPEENLDYIEADWEQRERVFQRHRDLVLGLLYFVQNDREVPEEHRKMARQYHLPMDEFTDNGHFPWQLYVREGRRLKGKFTLTENDFNPPGSVNRSSIFYDSVMAGEFPVDSFPVTKEPSAGSEVLEGYICLLEISPYQVPLRVFFPETIEQVIVPVAASTSHVAFSTIRMEPMWMGMGQVAGTLAHLSVKNGLSPSSVPVYHLQKLLIENGQVLTYFDDINERDKAFHAAQFWGTKGFFKTYKASLGEPISTHDLNQWLEIFEGELPGGEKQTVNRASTEQKAIRISGFRLLLDELSQKWNCDAPYPSSWLYDSTDSGRLLMRGEACLAFYNLYFLVQDEPVATGHYKNVH